ncbi:MAG: glycosyltransferase family 4 protein [Lentisphaerae bacterium]|nr:glycosyltransferase family 4 protein [Lentisphaerota bacterium]
MRIAYISNSIVPSPSANSIHVMRMCQAFAKNGHTVLLLARKPETPPPRKTSVFEYYGVSRCFQLRRLPYPAVRGQSMIYAAACAFVAALWRPDVVYGRDVRGCAAAARLGIKTVAEVHSPVWENSGATGKAFLFLLRSRNLLRIVTVSGVLRDLHLEAGHLDASYYTVAHDASDEAPDERRAEDWQGRPNILQVGYVGSVYKQQGIFRGRGIGLLLQLAQRMPEVDFHIVGGTTADVSALWGGELPANLHCYGFRSPAETYAYRNCCDVLVAPYAGTILSSSGDRNRALYMSPLKVFEYMSSRKAILASDLPVLREVLNESNAVLVPPGNVEAWERALRGADPTTRHRVAEQAYADFRTKYTWHHRAQAVLQGLEHEPVRAQN